MAIIDASVCAAIFLEGDRFNKKAQRFLGKLVEQDETLRVPAIVFAEVAGAIRRRTGKPRLASGAVAKMLSLGLESREVDESSARAAADVAARLGVRGAGAFYIALAKECGDTLYTFDDEQKSRASNEVEACSP